MATERRLVDVDVLIAGYKVCVENDPHEYISPAMIVSDLESQPLVDAVEVVRCKDCKNYDNSEGICWCKLNSKFYPGGMDWHCFPEDGFCSYGEKK